VVVYEVVEGNNKCVQKMRRNGLQRTVRDWVESSKGRRRRKLHASLSQSCTSSKSNISHALAYILLLLYLLLQLFAACTERGKLRHDERVRLFDDEASILVVECSLHDVAHCGIDAIRIGQEYRVDVLIQAAKLTCILFALYTLVPPGIQRLASISSI